MTDGPFKINTPEIIPSIEGVLPTERIGQKRRVRDEGKGGKGHHQEPQEEKEEKKEEHKIDILA